MRRISYCCSPAAVLCLVLGRLEDVSSQAPVPPQYDRLRELVIQKKAMTALSTASRRELIDLGNEEQLAPLKTTESVRRITEPSRQREQQELTSIVSVNKFLSPSIPREPMRKMKNAKYPKRMATAAYAKNMHKAKKNIFKMGMMKGSSSMRKGSFSSKKKGSRSMKRMKMPKMKMRKNHHRQHLKKGGDYGKGMGKGYKGTTKGKGYKGTTKGKGYSYKGKGKPSTPSPTVTPFIWELIPPRILGENTGDQLGRSVAINAEGTIMAVGVPGFDSGRRRRLQRRLSLDDESSDADGDGLVRVFQRASDSSPWQQLGQDLTSASFMTPSEFGFAVDLDDSGFRLAVGAPGFNQERGVVYTYELNVDTSMWEAFGSAIMSGVRGERLGMSVSLSGSGVVVAAGAPVNDSGGEDTGRVVVSEISDIHGFWTQRGEFFGSAGDLCGTDVSLSEDGLTLAYGCPGSLEDAGSVFILRYSEMFMLWSPYGSTISGSAPGEECGITLQLSDSAGRLVVGCPQTSTDFSGSSFGVVRVFSFEFGDWEPLDNIEGENESSAIGTSVSISGNGQEISYFSGTCGERGSLEPDNAVRVVVARFDRTEFRQLGPMIQITDVMALLPFDLNLSRDGLTIVVGAVGVEDDSGSAQAFQFVRESSPTQSPTGRPVGTVDPTEIPDVPTSSPTPPEPSSTPSALPRSMPTFLPTLVPQQPSSSPVVPTESPSLLPTFPPSDGPTQSPVAGTETPTSSPTFPPSDGPTQSPVAGTETPTSSPSASPTISPEAGTEAPTVTPTSSPTSSPIAGTASPTVSPSVSPTNSPVAGTASPTVLPSSSPTTSPETPTPTSAPSTSPTSSPIVATGTPSTASPTDEPSLSPTSGPTSSPSTSPTGGTSSPTLQPTSPSASPTVAPTMEPSSFPSLMPTGSPQAEPGASASIGETDSPSEAPVSAQAASTQSSNGIPFGWKRVESVVDGASTATAASEGKEADSEIPPFVIAQDAHENDSQRERRDETDIFT